MQLFFFYFFYFYNLLFLDYFLTPCYRLSGRCGRGKQRKKISCLGYLTKCSKRYTLWPLETLKGFGKKEMGRSSVNLGLDGLKI